MQDVVNGDLVSEFGPRNGRYGRILTESKRGSELSVGLRPFHLVMMQRSVLQSESDFACACIRYTGRKRSQEC